MVRKIFLAVAIAACTHVAMWADGHTQFLGLSLGMQPTQLIADLQDKGLQQKDAHIMTGRLAGLDVQLFMNFNKDTTSVNNLQLTTRHLSGRDQRDDYATLMKWMRKHYGAPTWESTVRGHAFARWYVGFDRDIVMIASAPSAVDVWFYDNHKMRNEDYYSILKYCERNPVEEVPYYTARQCVTWRSAMVPTAKKIVKGKGKHKLHKVSHSRHHKAKAKGKARRRRR